MNPNFNIGDKVVVYSMGPLHGALGTVSEVLPGRGGQRFVYIVAVGFEFPETALELVKRSDVGGVLT